VQRIPDLVYLLVEVSGRVHTIPFQGTAAVGLSRQGVTGRFAGCDGAVTCCDGMSAVCDWGAGDVPGSAGAGVSAARGCLFRPVSSRF